MRVLGECITEVVHTTSMYCVSSCSISITSTRQFFFIHVHVRTHWCTVYYDVFNMAYMYHDPYMYTGYWILDTGCHLSVSLYMSQR